MFKKMKVLLAFILIVGALVIGSACAINMMIFRFSNPDMTAIRCAMENKDVVIIGVCSAVAGYIGLMIAKSLE